MLTVYRPLDAYDDRSYLFLSLTYTWWRRWGYWCYHGTLTGAGVAKMAIPWGEEQTSVLWWSGIATDFHEGRGAEKGIYMAVDSFLSCPPSVVPGGICALLSQCTLLLVALATTLILYTIFLEQSVVYKLPSFPLRGNKKVDGTGIFTFRARQYCVLNAIRWSCWGRSYCT